MSILPEYMNDVVNEMSRKSKAIRRDFATHRLSAGTNREDLVEGFLRAHLPKRFGIGTGLIISHDGMFSKQADLVVVDEQNNAPLYPNATNKIWPVEAVYALIEVKTKLDPHGLRDSIDKGRTFKRLPRRFCDTGLSQRIKDTLFLIWAFQSASPGIVKAHLVNYLRDVANAERPDFVVVPDRLVAKSGTYLEISKLGQPRSTHRRSLQQASSFDTSETSQKLVEVAEMDQNALLAWFIWFDSWLRQAGPRFVNPALYLPPNRIYGHVV